MSWPSFLPTQGCPAFNSTCVNGIDPRIKLALEIVAKELDHPLLVNMISSRLGLSGSRFQHLFKKETGRSFKAFVKDARLQRAKELLIDPTRRVKEVAAAVGFNFAANFTHDFTIRFGRPPSQHRIPSV